MLWYAAAVSTDWLLNSQEVQQSTSGDFGVWEGCTLISLAATATWFKLSSPKASLLILLDAWFLRLLGPLATPVFVPVVIIVVTRLLAIKTLDREPSVFNWRLPPAVWWLTVASSLTWYLTLQYMSLQRLLPLVLIWSETATRASVLFEKEQRIPAVLGIGCWAPLVFATRLSSAEITWLMPTIVAAAILFSPRGYWNFRRSVGMVIGAGIMAASVLVPVEKYLGPLLIFWAGVWSILYGYFFLEPDDRRTPFQSESNALEVPRLANG